MRKKSTFLLLLKQMRPKQWSKNFLLFLPLCFSIDVANYLLVGKTAMGFLLFCFVSSCVYILNDFVDRESDRKHPKKKNRPMASGLLNPYGALIFGFFMLIFSFVFSFKIDPMFFLILLLYFTLNIFYSFWLKRVVIIDIMIIATGFVLRALSGCFIIHVQFTPWFLMCTMLLALFLAIGKRRHELHILEDKKGEHRKVLEHYTIEFLDQMNSIVATATLISYSLFTFNSQHSVQLMWTIPFVFYGIFRYLYLVYVQKEGGKPEELLFKDKHIFGTVVGYMITLLSVLYFV